MEFVIIYMSKIVGSRFGGIKIGLLIILICLLDILMEMFGIFEYRDLGV